MQFIEPVSYVGNLNRAARYMFAVIVLFGSLITASAQSFKKEQVVELAETILTQEPFAKYKKTFIPREKDGISYDSKDGTWRVMFHDSFHPKFTGSTMPIFLIRDADGFFKIGISEGFTYPKSLREFRSHPTVARKYRQLTGKK